MQDTETLHMEEASCRETAPHSLLLPEAGQMLRITTNFSKMGTQPSSAFPSPPAAFAHTETRPWQDARIKALQSHSIPVSGRCCSSSKEFNPDTGSQRGGSAQTFLHC